MPRLGDCLNKRCALAQNNSIIKMLCSPCIKRFLVPTDSPLCLHVGEVMDGGDMRAEVGLLTRNTLI